jgi:putative transposase
MKLLRIQAVYRKHRTTIPDKAHKACPHLLRVDALEEALRGFGTPEIFNTDQGSQFTSERVTTVLKDAGIKISMDGKGRWMDNAFIERLWRSVKYGEASLKGYEAVADAKAEIGSCLAFYNSGRTHQSLGRLTPGKVFC